jgi:hypothetical protein
MAKLRNASAFILLAAVVLVVAFLPLLFGQTSNQNNFGGSGGGGVTITTVSGLSSIPGKTKGTIATVTDGTTATDCATGGGSIVVVCQYSGSTWAAVPPTIPSKQFLTTQFTQTFSSAFSPAAMVGLSWPIAGNTNYVLQCDFNYTASASTAGLNFALTGPALPSLVTETWVGNGASAVATATAAAQQAAAFPTQFGMIGTGIVTAATTDWVHFTVIIENAATAGTLQVQAGAESTGTVTVNAYAGGCVLY